MKLAVPLVPATTVAGGPDLEPTFYITDQVRHLGADDVDAAIRSGNSKYPGAHSERPFDFVISYDRLPGMPVAIDLASTVGVVMRSTLEL